MSPQLIEAVRERIMLGYTKEQVYSELKQAGYDDLTIEQAYQRAGAPQAAQPISASTMPPQEEQAATPGGAVTQSVRQLSSFGQMFSGSFRYVWGA
jgi:SOS response regulatory protein OraA/RecX